MHGIELSEHAKDMLNERDIPEEWMWRTLGTPERVQIGTDNNTHYTKAIPE